MSYRVLTTDLSDIDMARNISYIIDVLGNRKAAADLLDRYEEVKTEIGDNPLAFQFSNSKRLADLGVRVRFIGGYAVHYKLIEDRVYILRVVSTLMDVESDEFLHRLNSAVDSI
ncbi:MAG: hypothetical protein IJ592_00735 [Candidatus Methanomethylophilaceae archaeon]|nr:hypothetical protein [Candidatus Methanomethylophilaceae archaeon]